MKNLEKAAREGERAASLGSCWDYLQGIGPAIEAYAATAQHAASLAALPEQAVAPQLLEAGRAAVARTSAAQVGPVLPPGPFGFRGPFLTLYINYAIFCPFLGGIPSASAPWLDMERGAREGP